MFAYLQNIRIGLKVCLEIFLFEAWFYFYLFETHILKKLAANAGILLYLYLICVLEFIYVTKFGWKTLLTTFLYIREPISLRILGKTLLTFEIIVKITWTVGTSCKIMLYPHIDQRNNSEDFIRLFFILIPWADVKCDY